MSANRDGAAGPSPYQALASAFPDARTFVHVRRWLAWLAFRMKDDTSLLWWRVPLWLPHARIRTAYQVLLAVGLAVAFWGPVAIITRQPGGQVLWLVPFGALGGLAFGTKVATSSRLYSAVPLRIVPRWPRLQGWVVLVLCVIVPVLLVPSLLLMWSRPATERPAATPVSTYRDDRTVRLLSGAGLVVGIGIVLVDIMVLVPLMTGRAGAFALAVLVVALVAGCLFALSRGAVSRVLLAELVLSVEWHERIHFARLLRDAAKRGILRQHGAAFEFADPALQRELVAFHETEVVERAQRWAQDSGPARTGLYDRLFSWLSPANADRLGRDVGIGLCGLLLTLIITLKIHNFPAMDVALTGKVVAVSALSWEVLAGFVVMILAAVFCCALVWLAISGLVRRLPGVVLRMRVTLRRARRWRRYTVGALAVAGLALIVVASGPSTVWRAIQVLVGLSLPAVFALTLGVWLFIVVRRWARGRRWTRYLPDVVIAVVFDAVCVLLVNRALLTAAPAAGLLFPVGIALSVIVWRRMHDSPRLTARAGADVVFSLLLGVNLILLLLWLANLLAFPGVEVAVLRTVLERAGAVVDLPWWLWTALFAALAGFAVVRLARPAQTHRIAVWLRRFRVNQLAIGGKRALTGIHIGLMTASLIGLVTPAAVAPALRSQLRDAYAVDLRNEVDSRGESVAYQEISDTFLHSDTVVPVAVLAELVAQIHRSSSAQGNNIDLNTEKDLAYRLGQLQAAALTVGDTPPVLTEDSPADLDEPVRDAGDLDARLDELDTERTRSDDAKHQAERAGELATSALSNVVQVPGLSDAEVYQILTEYLSGLIENSPLRERFAAWAERLGERALPSGADLAVPDSTKLEAAATSELNQALSNDPLGQLEVAQRLSGKSPISIATDLANQVRYLQEGSGPCAGCLPPSQPNDNTVEGNPGGYEIESHGSG